MTRVLIGVKPRICQGDVYRKVEMIERVVESSGDLEISRITFPLVVVLTQDCDLEQDHRHRSQREQNGNQDKVIISALVAPLYNIQHVYEGEHLSELNLKMQLIPRGRTHGRHLRQNQLPRYHFLSFPKKVHIVDSVVDFKHYFSVNIPYLRSIKKKRFVCRIDKLYREDLSHRFASFLARIGLPPRADIGDGS